MNNKFSKRVIFVTLALVLAIVASIIFNNRFSSTTEMTLLSSAEVAKADRVKGSESQLEVKTPVVSTGSVSQAPVVATVPVTKPKAKTPKVATPTPTKSPSVKVTVLKGTTVTTKTQTGTQTLTVKTDKVKVAVTLGPTPTVILETVPTLLSPTKAVLPPADWDGFIAPKIAFDKLLSCVRSKETFTHPISGQPGKPWLVNWQVKLYDGYFNYDGRLYTKSDVLYLPVSDDYVKFWGNENMDFPLGRFASNSFFFPPLNWKNDTFGRTADSTTKEITYTYLLYSTQKECDNI